MKEQSSQNEISSFYGEHWFLSNFCSSELIYKGEKFATAEHAFQAHKATNEKDFKMIQNASVPGMAKYLARRIKLRAGWDNVKYMIMLDIVRAKFKNKKLADKLLATGDKKLTEGNTWHDVIWGKCICSRCKHKGKNWLGEILMRVRDEIRSEDEIRDEIRAGL